MPTHVSIPFRGRLVRHKRATNSRQVSHRLSRWTRKHPGNPQNDERQREVCAVWPVGCLGIEQRRTATKPSAVGARRASTRSRRGKPMCASAAPGACWYARMAAPCPQAASSCGSNRRPGWCRLDATTYREAVLPGPSTRSAEVGGVGCWRKSCLARLAPQQAVTTSQLVRTRRLRCRAGWDYAHFPRRSSPKSIASTDELRCVQEETERACGRPCGYPRYLSLARTPSAPRVSRRWRR
jgi:hypothetical protein